MTMTKTQSDNADMGELREPLAIAFLSRAIANVLGEGPDEPIDPQDAFDAQRIADEYERLSAEYDASNAIAFADPPTVRFIDVQVVDGMATLPDGRTTRSSAQVVRVPILQGSFPPLPPVDDDDEVDLS